jgi:hypothetical protein
MGMVVSTVAVAEVAGSAGDGEVSGAAGVTEAVPDDWVQPAINVHAIITRKRKNPEYLIHSFSSEKALGFWLWQDTGTG